MAKALPWANDPLQRIEWCDWSELDPNDYNPNVVMSPELRLLERSILATGWVQPVLAHRESRRIIDGFHRWTLTRESDALRAVYGGRLPVAWLEITRAEAMIVTVRMNRAKGSHVALRMSHLVRELLEDHGVPADQLAAELGATADEIELLRQQDVFKARGIPERPYSKAWVPRESRTHPKPSV